MTVVSNPFVLGVVGRQRRDEFLAEADRERLVSLAADRRGADRRLPWADVAVGAIVAALAVGAARQ